MVFYSTNDPVESWVHTSNLRSFLYLVVYNRLEAQAFCVLTTTDSWQKYNCWYKFKPI